MLTEKKAELGHGNFIPWVEAKCDFSARVAQMAMRSYSKTKSTSHLTESDALAISRDTWGNSGGSVVDKYSGQDEWYTPSEYVEAVRNCLGFIDLDPASNEVANRVVKAATYYTAEDDGLSQDWFGNVFLNPPYKQPLVAQFTQRLVDSYIAGQVSAAVLLTNNSTDTLWWHGAASVSAAACFTRGRISFYRDKEYDSPTNGQVFLYFGQDVGTFRREFQSFGWIALQGNG